MDRLCYFWPGFGTERQFSTYRRSITVSDLPEIYRTCCLPWLLPPPVFGISKRWHRGALGGAVIICSSFLCQFRSVCRSRLIFFWKAPVSVLCLSSNCAGCVSLREDFAFLWTVSHSALSLLFERRLEFVKHSIP